IPAPRRKRPTPVMITTPQQQAQAKATASAAARRTVPFAMPSPLKKTAPGTGGPIDAGRPDRTLPIPGAQEQAAAANLGRAMPPRQVMPPREPPPARESQPRAQQPSPAPSREPPPPRPSDPARIDTRAAGPKPLGDTLPGVPSPAGDEVLGLPAPTPKSSVPAPMPLPATPGPVAVVPAEAVTGLRQKLEALDLTREQIDGVLALSREIVEQVVWEVVPTLAETLIREEIRRLTSE
ncbi:MAG TPA: hypothetical protein VFB62_04090, partial [Polyangiaceae bacterium]|nr:hypothetical protein [Polyangiaceae bacterium]